MPYVTDEIYDMLPIKESENIMISEYPMFNKDYIYEEIEEKVNDMIGFIKAFRNFKQENSIFKDYDVMIEDSEDYSIIRKILKLEDFLVSEESDKPKFTVQFGRFKAVVFYLKEETEEDVKLKEKQIENLRASISKRERLLSNQGFVSKAPDNLVNDEKKKLDEEKKLLESLLI